MRNTSSKIFKLSKKAKDGVKSKMVSRATLQKNLSVTSEDYEEENEAVSAMIRKETNSYKLCISIN